MEELKKRSSPINSDNDTTMDSDPETSTPVLNGAQKQLQYDHQRLRLRDRTQKLRSEMLSEMDTRIGKLLEEFVTDLEKKDNVDGAAPDAKKKKRSDDLPEKEFFNRSSLLTELLEISHIRTIYHIFIAIFILFSLNTFVFEIVENGRIDISFENVWWNLSKFSTVISLWVAMNLALTIIVYPCFQNWATYRRPGKVGLWDYVWLSFYALYLCAFLYYPIETLFRESLPPVSAVIVVAEQVRLMMKTHAFVRSNIPRVYNYDPKSAASSEGPCPDFGKFLYFIFAPTLVYRDSYPRTSRVRWGYVVGNFIQVVGAVFYVYYIFERFCIPVFRDFSKAHITPKSIILSSFGCMMPGTLVLFLAFFTVLHSWLNAFAEMLRFGDRMFYKDWWNSSSFATYYRTWNVVVHDWLYSYVYRDVFMLLGSPRGGASRPAAMASVFFLSAVFHEYILVVSLGFFYPVLFVMFGTAGFGLMFIPSKWFPRSGNVMMWVGLFMGTGILMCLYSMEWYARQNCPPVSDNFLDLLLPRSWFCDLPAPEV